MLNNGEEGDERGALQTNWLLENRQILHFETSHFTKNERTQTPKSIP